MVLKFESFINGKAAECGHFCSILFISKMFSLNFSLPTEIYSTQNNREQVLQEIHRTIEILYGTKCTLYPPFMAFETVVRKQILQLENPIMSCVDLVIEELSNAVRKCTRNVSHCTEFNSENHRNETN